jgi:hypothetical protein
VDQRICVAGSTKHAATYFNGAAFRWLKLRPSSPLPPGDRARSRILFWWGGSYHLGAVRRRWGAARIEPDAVAIFDGAMPHLIEVKVGSNSGGAAVPAGEQPSPGAGTVLAASTAPAGGAAVTVAKVSAPPHRLRGTRWRSRPPQTQRRPWPRVRPPPQRRKTNPSRQRIRRERLIRLRGSRRRPQPQLWPRT